MLDPSNFGAFLIRPELSGPSGLEGGTHSTDEETEDVQLGSDGLGGLFQSLSSFRHPPKGGGWEKRQGARRKDQESVCRSKAELQGLGERGW